jgi:TRAP-type transport system periplasmic protein
MKRFMVPLVLVMVIGALILSSCTNAPTTTLSSSSSPNAVRTIKFSYTMPRGAAIAKGFDWFGPAFEQATNGRYKIETYPGGILHPGNATLDVIKSGAVEMAYTSCGTHPKQFPLTMVNALPSLGFPQNSVKINLASNAAFKELVDTTPEVKNEFKDFTLIQTFLLAPYKLVSKKAQVKSAADFKWMRVGGTGSKMEIVVANGGAKVQEIPTDSYLNMDKGVTDASFLTWSEVENFKIYEIANFFLDHNFGNANGVIIMNTNFYNSLGAADQKILTDTWTKAQEVCIQGSYTDTASGLKNISNAGKSIYTPTAAEEAAWDASCVPAIDSWRTDAKLMGMTDVTLDAIFAKWQEVRTKYLAIGAQ